MGIEYSAAIIVGLRRGELEDHENFEDFENGDLDSVSPYFDGWQDAIFGVIAHSAQDYSASEIEGSIDQKIEKASAEFTEKTGREGKVFLTLDVC